MNYAVTTVPVSLIEESAIQEINALTDLTWPETKPAEFTERSRIEDFLHRNPGKFCHMIYDGDQLIGYAESFPREISADQQRQTIMGLGAVCVHPQFKGNGLGAMLVQAAFARVDDEEFTLSLFQTGVPGFYHKLNCRTIDNRIVNSLHDQPEQNPFWDPYIMIYPNSQPGFLSDIDLLGPGY
ncbi:GNAT family N-acetyltransferase [Roseivirga sp.]|uniref:GNAT family N-acetyltransferase n=1 Tax=Roseivirga sp. TaxID=1964215 RepID=UPI003B51E51B